MLKMKSAIEAEKLKLELEKEEFKKKYKEELSKILEDSTAEKRRLKSIKNKIEIYILTPTNKTITLSVHTSDFVEDIKADIQMKEGISPEKYKLYWVGGIMEDKNRLYDYLVFPYSTIYLFYSMRGGGCRAINYQSQRNFVSVDMDDLISIVLQPKVNCCRQKVPRILNNDSKFSGIIEKVEKWNDNKEFACEKENIVGTLSCLIYMVKIKKRMLSIVVTNLYESHQIFERNS